MAENSVLAGTRSARRQVDPAARSPLPEDARIDRSTPIPDQVYRLLRQAILSLAMPPGAAIVEKEITERLGISRTPVRDAIRQLADERLVDIKPQSGTYVALIDRHQLEQGRLIRRALEVEGVKLAAPHMDEATRERLEDLIALQARAAARGRHEEFIAQDDAFHRAVSELSGYERFWPTINRSKAHLDRVRYLSSPLPHQASKAIAQHRAILKALASGEPERAAKAMAHHLDDAYARLSVVLKKHAAMFR
jgi:GntR family transcriptional regulator, rspAB operon transcriptional repressor